MSKPLSEGDLNEIRDEIFAGRKISAIKLYRRYSGLGLSEAKDAVEEMERKLRQESSGKFAVGDPEGGQQKAKSVPGVQVGKGCFGMFAVIALAAILALAVLTVWR